LGLENFNFELEYLLLEVLDEHQDHYALMADRFLMDGRIIEKL
jgi:hypothetical protein